MFFRYFAALHSLHDRGVLGFGFGAADHIIARFNRGHGGSFVAGVFGDRLHGDVVGHDNAVEVQLIAEYVMHLSLARNSSSDLAS